VISQNINTHRVDTPGIHTYHYYTTDTVSCSTFKSSNQTYAIDLKHKSIKNFKEIQLRTLYDSTILNLQFYINTILRTKESIPQTHNVSWIHRFGLLCDLRINHLVSLARVIHTLESLLSLSHIPLQAIRQGIKPILDLVLSTYWRYRENGGRHGQNIAVMKLLPIPSIKWHPCCISTVWWNLNLQFNPSWNNNWSKG
jgi:hypothetical protein